VKAGELAPPGGVEHGAHFLILHSGGVSDVGVEANRTSSCGGLRRGSTAASSAEDGTAEA
jgi:hypothetical protein